MWACPIPAARWFWAAADPYPALHQVGGGGSGQHGRAHQRLTDTWEAFLLAPRVGDTGRLFGASAAWGGVCLDRAVDKASWVMR